MNELIKQLLRASQWHFVGRLARDPEVRFFESGNCVCNARILINQPGAKRDDGKEPDGFKLELWGEKAQAFADAVSKGDLISVSGQVKIESWTDRTGEEQHGLTVLVQNWELVAKPQSGATAAAAQPAAAPAPAKTEPDWLSSDEVPF
jgi:single-strand DNA-binding protein